MKNFVGNMLSSIKNGQLSSQNFILVPRTKFCEQILNVLWNEGFILGYTLNKTGIKVLLKYVNQKPAISFIHCLSKPSKRIYYSAEQIWKLNSSQYFIIFSTNKGLKTLLDCKKENLGGEPIIIAN